MQSSDGLCDLMQWNRMPEKMRNLQSLQFFKSSLKTHLFSCTAWPDKQDTDADIVTADISRSCNGFVMLRHIIKLADLLLLFF